MVTVLVLQCPVHLDACVSECDPVDVLLIPGCRTDVSVVVLIGLLRWRLGMKRCEIQVFLQRKGIYLSLGVISLRSLDFLLLFKEFHKEMRGELKVFFECQQGMILHVDGTFRSGGKVVYVLQDDRSEIIADAVLIPSEAEEYVTPVFQDFKDCFGSPLGVVRDMADGVALSVSSVFPQAFQQVCHVHFMRNFEKDLISDLHTRLKRLMVKHRLTSRLRSLRSDAGDDVVDMKGLQRLWVHVIVDYLLYPLGGRVKWMSCSLSYCEQYRRVKEVSVLVRRLILLNASHNFMCEEVMDLDRYLQSILKDSKISHAFHVLRKTVEWLDEFCDLLKVSCKQHLKDYFPDIESLEDCKKLIKKRLNEVVVESRELEGDYERIALRIKNGFERHWDELFIPDPVVNGKRLSFRRHNNGLESSHRRMRKAIRERTGRAETNREMEQFGDLLALLSNLWNKTYQKEILCTVNDFAFSLNCFVDALPTLRKEYRRVRVGPEISISDGKRMDVLTGFVELLESGGSFDELFSPLKKILSSKNI